MEPAILFWIGGRFGGVVLGQQLEPPKELQLLDGKQPHPRPSPVTFPRTGRTQTFMRLFSASAGKQPLKFFSPPRREKTSLLSTDCLKMKKTAHSSILRQQNKGFRAKTCLKMKNSRSFFILRHGNELEKGSKRNQRRYLPFASASSGVGSRCRPRISSWTEAHPAAEEKKISPARIASSGSLFPARISYPYVSQNEAKRKMTSKSGKRTRKEEQHISFK